MSTTTSWTSPGRLGEPALPFTSDPRLDPRLKRFLETVGWPISEVQTIERFSIDDLRPFIDAVDQAFQGVADNMQLDLPENANEPEVIETSQTIRSFDGSYITLTFFRRADSQDKMTPAVLYIHGGAMTIAKAYNPVSVRWCRSLAVAGLTAVMVDFRNAHLGSAHHPFPTGLNDCAAALDYVFDNKRELGVSKIVLHGESGGANLSIATAMKAKREGKIDRVAGVHAYAPYISNAYHWPEERKLKELPSLVECDAYVLDRGTISAFGFYYGPDDMENPHAWPYHASPADLEGLPPHVLTIEELDPLRDEGIVFHRKLLAAGVKSTASIGLGMLHGGRVMFRQAIPNYYDALLNEVVSFAKGL